MSPAKKAVAKSPARPKETNAEEQVPPTDDATTQAMLDGYLNWSNQPQLHCAGLAQFQMWITAFRWGHLRSESTPRQKPVGRILS